MTPVNRSRLAGDVLGRDIFQFDSKGFATKCPMECSPIGHRVLSGNNTNRRSLHAIFDGNTCRSCKMPKQCPVCAPNHQDPCCQAREIVGDFRLEITPKLRLRDQIYANQQTTQWKDRYKIRSGIEATNSELRRSHGIVKLRVHRAVKGYFAVGCNLIACNIKRWANANLSISKTSYGTLFLLLWLIYKHFKLRMSKTNLYMNNLFFVIPKRALTSQESFLKGVISSQYQWVGS
jgi:hypothetical protein